MRIRIDKRIVFLSLFFFFLIFMPPIFPIINILYVLDVFAAFMIVVKYQKECWELLHINAIRKFTISFWLVACIIIIHTALDYLYISRLELNEYVVNAYRFVGVGLLVYIAVLYCVCYCRRENLSSRDVIKCIINAGLIEAFFTVITLLSPTAKLMLFDIYTNNVYGGKVSFAPWMYNERFFGFANTMFDGFGYGTGIISGIAFILLFEGRTSISKILSCFFLLLMPTVNAITGVLIFAIAVFLRAVVLIKKQKINGNSIIKLIIFISSIAIAIAFLVDKAKYAMTRLIVNVRAILGRYDGITSYSNLKRKSYWTIPTDSVHMLFGTGHTVYTTKQFIHSDVGYVNMLWLCGIVGCIFLYSIFFLLFYRSIKSCNHETNRLIGLLCLFAFFFFEFKGIGIAINTGIPVIFLLCFSFLSDYSTRLNHY